MLSASVNHKPVNRNSPEMGNLKMGVGNIVTVGLIAFASVWLINRGLAKVGKTSLQA